MEILATTRRPRKDHKGCLGESCYGVQGFQSRVAFQSGLGPTVFLVSILSSFHAELQPSWNFGLLASDRHVI